ncbi:DUF2871 domain-containing protein [Actinoallomurus purpureus]|uniref:DUF2871 domain-containing protein n=1 Tax=Actinoallomurus purpureus TaxID=478114 RepID=UPI0020939D2D|nr:DUF2871 domain-containing protein [Actinoallomurus purpureus]MCO6007918.1 DUF2871 domain-containing protein [Actinoallomurus purpureus]
MRKLYNAAHLYMIIGLVSGLAYREITKIKHFTGETQLGLVHTHVLALGMLFFLIVLMLEKQFALSAVGLFDWFFWIYNAGLAVTVVMMTLHGTLTVLGHESGDAIAMVAGLGHILLTVGLILFFVTLGKRIPARREVADQSTPAGRPAAEPLAGG